MEHDLSELIVPDNIYELPHCETSLVTSNEAARLYESFANIHDQIAAGTITLDYLKLAIYNGCTQHPRLIQNAPNLTMRDTGLSLEYSKPTDEVNASFTIKLTQLKTGKTPAEHEMNYQLFLPESGAPWSAMMFKVTRDRKGDLIDGLPHEHSWHLFNVEELVVMSELLTFISDPANHFDENTATADLVPEEAKNRTMRKRIAGLFSRARRQDEI